MKSLVFKLFLLVITLSLCCPISSGQQSPSNINIPAGWKKFNADGRIAFYLPPNAWETGLRGLDEYYREWRIRRMRFKIVYEPMGWLSYDRREKQFGKDFKESVIEAGGRKAYLCESSRIEKGRRWYYVDLYVGEWPQSEVKLWMQAASARPTDVETAKKIFQTLEFLKP